ncbi:MAG TPA: TolC family protein [Nitrospirota bacterium]|nr:TolC family protein [Nitrospirota bacterium]
MWIQLVVLIFVVLFEPSVSCADDSLITLKDLVQEALNNNPEIHMAEKRVESAEQKKSLASALPDPMIGYMVQNVGSPGPWTVGVQDMSMQGVVFTQEIPFPGKLETKGRIAGKEEERTEQGARETKLKVLNNLRSAYYEYFLAFKSAEILDQTKEILKNFQRIAETRYETGQGMQQDVIRAQLEVSMILDRLAEEEQQKEAQASVINSLVGRNPLAPLGRPDELPRKTPAVSVDELAAMALEHSPMLQGKQRMVAQSREELSLSRREYLPDMVVSGGWFTRGEKTDVWQASVMFKIPLYFWNTATGVNAATADLSAARYEYDAERLATLAQVRDLYSKVKTAEHHIQLYEAGIIPQAKLSLQSATSNYQVGKTDFMTLLESENMFLKYQLMEQEELVNLNKTMSMLGEITGEEHEN